LLAIYFNLFWLFMQFLFYCFNSFVFNSLRSQLCGYKNIRAIH